MLFGRPEKFACRVFRAVKKGIACAFFLVRCYCFPLSLRSVPASLSHSYLLLCALFLCACACAPCTERLLCVLSKCAMSMSFFVWTTPPMAQIVAALLGTPPPCAESRCKSQSSKCAAKRQTPHIQEISRKRETMSWKLRLKEKARMNK